MSVFMVHIMHRTLRVSNRFIAFGKNLCEGTIARHESKMLDSFGDITCEISKKNSPEVLR